jgi:Gram-negative bacterial TonB protein C-terminal
VFERPLRLRSPKFAAGDIHFTEAIVGKDGRAEKVSLISGDSSVARSAISAVKKWLFKPYIYNGDYVEMESDLHLHFPVSK